MRIATKNTRYAYAPSAQWCMQLTGCHKQRHCCANIVTASETGKQTVGQPVRRPGSSSCAAINVKMQPIAVHFINV